MVNNQLYVLGGSETYMFFVGDELTRQGHTVQYFGKEDKEGKHGNEYGIYAVSGKTPSSKIVNRENCRRFGKLLDLYRPDVIHCNLVYFALTPAIFREAKKRNIPLIQTVHDPKIVCPNHRLMIERRMEPCLKCTKGDTKYCVKNKCIRGSLAGSMIAKKESDYHFRKKTYALVDRFVFPSRFMYDLHVGHGVTEKQAVVLHNFSRIDRFSYDEKKGKYVLFLGRVSVEKGMEQLAEACRQLPDVCFKIVGKGPAESVFDGLPNCELTGFKEGTELTEIIANATCLILPSIWYENCPMSVAEAIALGTPVIGSDIGGIPELIRDGETGFVFEAGNVPEMVDRIRRIWEDDSLAKSMSDQCKKEDELMDMKAYTEKLLALYEQVRTEIGVNTEKSKEASST